MPNTYNYVNTQGQMQQFQADTPEAAIAGAPGIASDSGVQLVPQTGNPIFNTTNGQWADHNNATGALNTFTNSEDPYMQLFQQQKDANALAAGNAIASATAATERQTVKNEQDRNATLAGLATAAEKTGLAPNSAYQLQVIQGAKDQFNTRFALLDQQEKLAVAKAKAAQAVGDTAVLKEQLDYAVKLRKEKADALAEVHKLDWEKYKFEHMSAAQIASNRIAQQNADRLSGSGSSGGLKYTPSELKKLRAAGIDSTNQALSDKYLYGADKGVAPKKAAEFTKDYTVSTFGQDTMYNLARALGIPEMKGLFGKNWSKNNEIKALFNDPQLSSYIQSQFAEGLTPEDIISLNE